MAAAKIAAVDFNKMTSLDRPACGHICSGKPIEGSAVSRVRLQLEDAELATAAAVKARKAMEMELQDLQSQFEALSKSKQEVGICVCGLDICLETS